MRCVVVAAAFVALGWTVYDRFAGLHSQSLPPAPATAYPSEADWAHTEIVRDVTEMVARANATPAADLSLHITASPGLWEPDHFARAIGPALARRDAVDAGGACTDVHTALIDLRGATLVQVSERVSSALAANIRDVRAHEAAAVTLAAFALRESSDEMFDVRWALNRITAHLAMSAALGGELPAGTDGRIAHATLLALTDRQTDALEILDGLGRGEPAAAAWGRALRMRMTGDWRLLSEPSAASRIEKLAYFRARRESVWRSRAAEDLQRIDEPLDIDLLRLAASHSCCVEDGHAFIAPAFDYELTDIAAIHRAVRNIRLTGPLHEALNVRASGLVGPDGIHVLPWGAWAEFFQRHLAMHVGEIDSFYRYSLGLTHTAKEIKRQLDTQFGQLTMFPLGAIRRTKGPTGAEGDMALLGAASALASRAPELITHTNWHWMEYGQKYEPSVPALPPSARWFAPASAENPFEAGKRLTAQTPAATVDALLQRAPFDVRLVMAGLAPAGKGRRADRALPLVEARAAYDLRAMDALGLSAPSDEALATIQRRACAISSRDCVRLAWTLVRLGDEAGAAAHFERAFEDPLMDAVATANESSWLVNYYFERQQVRPAIELANSSASTGAWRGLVTSAYLQERLGNFDEAESLYERAARRYQRPEQLLGFYYREAVVRRRPSAKRLYEEALRLQFPEGLQPEPTTLTAPPRKGVFVYTDTPGARTAGLRAGDIIVGLEGWRVENVEQYASINAFFDTPEMRITLWRGQLITVEAKMPGRLFGVDLKTHPLQGWAEN